MDWKKAYKKVEEFIEEQNKEYAGRQEWENVKMGDTFSFGPCSRPIFLVAVSYTRILGGERDSSPIRNHFFCVAPSGDGSDYKVHRGPDFTLEPYIYERGYIYLREKTQKGMFPAGQVKYKLGLATLDFADNGRAIQFELFAPQHFDSVEEVSQAESDYNATMVKNDDGTVVIHINKSEIKKRYAQEVVETIRWDEHWKYRCLIEKEPQDLPDNFNSDTGYIPCSLKFEDVFAQYARGAEEDPECTRTLLLQVIGYITRPEMVSPAK